MARFKIARVFDAPREPGRSTLEFAMLDRCWDLPEGDSDTDIAFDLSQEAPGNAPVREAMTIFRRHNPPVNPYWFDPVTQKVLGDHLPLAAQLDDERTGAYYASRLSVPSSGLNLLDSTARTYLFGVLCNSLPVEEAARLVSWQAGRIDPTIDLARETTFCLRAIRQQFCEGIVDDRLPIIDSPLATKIWSNRARITRFFHIDTSIPPAEDADPCV